MAALTIGMWIVDKRVWRIKTGQMLLLMTLGACTGVLLVLYSPFPLVVNIAIAFLFAGISLLFTRASLFPMISACVLPVLLKTESWVYPVSVFVMTLIILVIQRWMEHLGLREKITYEAPERHWRADSLRWIYLMITVFAVASLAIYTSNFYFILPPLLVAYVEFVNSRAGFRNRPVLTVLLLGSGSLVSTLFQLIGYYYLGLSETLVAFFIFIVLFTLFEWLGKFFCTGRSNGPHTDVASERNSTLAPLTSIDRRPPIHYDGPGIFPAMLQMVTGPTDLLPDPALPDQPTETKWKKTKR